MALANKYTLSYLIVLLFGFATFACSDKTIVNEQDTTFRTPEQRLGTAFTPTKEAHFKAPHIRQLNISFHEDAAASWGATGKDDAGMIYLGLSTYSKYHDNSYLYQYNPFNQNLVLQGDTLSQLKKAGLYSTGMGQNKLHSKIYQADDGYLYFSTFDEEGESESKGILPTHGGNLWRKKPQDLDWEHLLATKEALIAVNTNGRYIYALGYWGHVLYQYDILNRRFNRVTVGASKGHTSRNIIVMENGHVFVPKLVTLPDQTRTAKLAEYTPDLTLVASHPLEHYATSSTYSDHGIISYANTLNGNAFFTTGAGAFYKIVPQKDNTYEVVFNGHLSEELGAYTYATGMFSIDGSDFIVVLGRVEKAKQHMWFIYEASTNTTVSYPIAEIGLEYLLYGSVTRDHKGDMYVTGVDRSINHKHKPVVFKLSFPELAKKQ